MAYNLSGYVTGDIKVLYKYHERDQNKRTQWACKCLCGNEFLTVTHRLTDRNLTRRQTSCGKCEWHIKHKDAYISWMGMNQRCLDSDCKDYPNYGGRGIKVCSRWHRFQEFYLDVGDPPKDIITGERMSLDRKDVNGNYEPNNCKWSTRSEQQYNKRR